MDDERAQAAAALSAAHEALALYGIQGAQVRPLLGLRLRGVFQVDTHTNGGRARFVLRMHPAGEGRDALESVLEWLVALRRDTNLGVPEPVPTLDGSLLPSIPARQDNGVGQGDRSCELLRWLDGRVPARTFSLKMMGRLGAFTATLHEHAVHFIPSPRFTRPPGDADRILRGEKRSAPGLESFCPASITTSELRMLVDVEARLHAAAHTLVRDRSTYGLMHGDLHPRNLLFHQGQVRAIDFELCGPDYFLYDLASSLVEGTSGWEILSPHGRTWHPAFATRRDVWLRGYKSVRTPPDAASHLATFIAIRALNSLPWLAEWAATRPDDTWSRMVLNARLRYLRSYLGGFV